MFKQVLYQPLTTTWCSVHMAIYLGIGAVLLLLAAVLRWRLGGEADGRQGNGDLIIDGEGITMTAPSFHKRLLWKEIRRVRIMTTSAGPWSEDLFYVIDQGGPNFVVPHMLAEEKGLLRALETNLGSIDESLVKKAMGSTSERFFTIWQAEGPSASSDP